MSKFYRYTVAGGGYFPVDMLRYDRCWPEDTESALKLGRRYEPGDAPVALVSNSPPTPERWRSFGWVVGKVKEYR